MNETVEPLPPELKKRAEQLAGESALMANALAQKARQRSAIKGIVDLTSATFGVVALVLSLSPDLRIMLGANIVSILIALAGISLLTGVIFDRFIMRDPPERFRDYSLYIGLNTEQIRDLLANEHDLNRIAKIEVINYMCGMNLADAKRNWPTLVPLAEK